MNVHNSRLFSSEGRIFCAVTSAITDAIRLAGWDAILCLVGHILLVAVGLVCVILLIKAGFDRVEARSLRKSDGKQD